MLKHLEGVKSQNNFQSLRHTYHWMVWLKRSKSQLSNFFFQIENQLNIKKVMSKNVFVPCFNITKSFDPSNIALIVSILCM